MKKIILLPFLLFSLLAISQESRYFIFLFKGDVWVRPPGKQAIKAKPKQYLSLNDSVILKNANSEITIGNTQGSWLLVKEKGAHKLADLRKKESLKGPGSTAKFLAFLYHELFQPHKPGKLSQESIAAAWGGSSRGACNFAKLPLEKLVTSKDTLLVQWYHRNNALKYNFILFDGELNQLFNCIVRDTQLIINTSPLRATGNSKYYWSVNSGNDDCSAPQYEIHLLSRQQEEHIRDSLIREIPVIDNEILYNLEIADQLGKNGLIEFALEYYYKSRKLIGK